MMSLILLEDNASQTVVAGPMGHTQTGSPLSHTDWLVLSVLWLQAKPGPMGHTQSGSCQCWLRPWVTHRLALCQCCGCKPGPMGHRLAQGTIAL